MEKLIKKIQRNWQKAKARAVAEAKQQGNNSLAYKLEQCTMFRGDESLEELIDLMFNPQGIEFLTTYGFPSLATFRKFKEYNPERYGVYIDCGNISLTDPNRAFLIGNTTAKITYTSVAGNRLNLMWGALAAVKARGYTLVRIEKDTRSEVFVDADSTAKVLR